MPEISIVVPVYKVEKHLAECVESLQKQTFQDIEIILVDDGSPDNCGMICDEFSSKDNRIKVIHQKNKGLSCARNAGAKLAIGKYICFVDSDDYVASEYCRTLYDLIKDSNCDYSVCGTCRFEDGKEPFPVHDAISGQYSNIEFLEMQLSKKSEFGVWNKLYRKTLLDKIEFSPNKIHEDVIWSVDLAKNCANGVICTEKQLYYYRQNSNGIVQQSSKKCSTDRIYAGEYLAQTVKVICPRIYKEALRYAIEYPWMFIDSIYVYREFEENEKFLNSMQKYLQSYMMDYIKNNVFSSIWTSRMKLFAKSKKMYAVNAYIRLIRVYLLRIFRLDAYKNGHGI